MLYVSKCIVQPFGIWKVKDTLVMSVHCNREYTICHLVCCVGEGVCVFFVAGNAFVSIIQINLKLQ
jgi:hypothetical protein